MPARTPRNAITDGNPGFDPLQMVVAYSGQIHRVADDERHRECTAQKALAVGAMAGVDRNWHTGNLVTKRAAKATAILRELHEQTPSLVEGRDWWACIASTDSTTIGWPLDNR